MNGQKTVARPYAKAIFELAAHEGALDYWSSALHLLSFIAREVEFRAICKNPRYSAKSVSELIVGIVKSANLYGQHLENFVLLLAHYKRLLVLPEIEVLFQESRAQIEKMVQVSVQSAQPISSETQKILKKNLETRLKREVSLHFSENSALIGGLVISAGDWVVDYSVKNHLEKLKQLLVS